jgi:hypothetical protein
MFLLPTGTQINIIDFDNCNHFHIYRILEQAAVDWSYVDDSSSSEGWSSISISDRMFVRSMSQLLFPSKENLTSLPLFADYNKTTKSPIVSSINQNQTKPHHLIHKLINVLNYPFK